MAAAYEGLIPCASHHDDTLQLVYISVLIVVSVLIMFLLHVLGSLRRRSSHKLLHAIVLGAYTLSYALVSYTLGLMQESEHYFDEFPVWAVCLLMLLGGTDNLMACRLNEVDNWKSFQVKHLLKGALVVYIVAYYSQHVPEYQKPLWAILFVNVLQSCVRIKSMKMASKSNLLSENVKPIVDHMKLIVDHMKSDIVDNQEKDKPSEFNPVTMKGYKYVVSGEHKEKNNAKKKEDDNASKSNLVSDSTATMTCSSDHSLGNHDKQPVDGSKGKEVDDMKITTVEQIWQCEESLLSSNSTRGMRLKDICLSMALSKMLNRRFAGFELAEAGQDKTHDFVFKGLLIGCKCKPYERAFRVIEKELGFVYDLYYTRYPFLYHKVRHFALCLPVAMVIFCSWLTYVLFKRHSREEYDTDSHVPLDTTMFLMVVVTFLEAFQLYLHIASDWFKVALIRSYVKRPALQKSFFEMIISLALRLKALRPWENKLGQYSLLHNYNETRYKSNCIHYVTLFLVDKVKKGRKRGNLVKLSAQVKEAVIDSLIRSNGYLTNGTTSLKKHTDVLNWACHFSTVTETILVWHVATTICKENFDAVAKVGKQTAPLSVQESSAVKTASSLSLYCAYLVAFAPDLLPGHSFESASTLDKAIQDAGNFEPLKEIKTIESKCKELLGHIKDSNSNSNDDPSKYLIIVQGAKLATQLIDIQDMVERWKLLSDFWAEMMLYITPCEDAKAPAHLEALARGGEFITHLWALLTHAGVLKRAPTGSEAV